jgi:hypothetical protein
VNFRYICIAKSILNMKSTNIFGFLTKTTNTAFTGLYGYVQFFLLITCDYNLQYVKCAVNTAFTAFSSKIKPRPPD